MEHEGHPVPRVDAIEEMVEALERLARVRVRLDGSEIERFYLAVEPSPASKLAAADLVAQRSDRYRDDEGSQRRGIPQAPRLVKDAQKDVLNDVFDIAGRSQGAHE